MSSLHHITLITRRAQANVDFYAGFLGLRLVKRTGGFEDATQLHLFYGDAEGSPGSLVTFLAWEDGAAGRAGAGAASDIALAIDPAAIGYWLGRAIEHRVKTEGPTREFGRPVLRLTDPDGITVRLVGVAGLDASRVWTDGGVPAEHAIRRLFGAAILSEAADDTAAFLQRYFGYAPLVREGATQRLVSAAGDAIDVRDAAGFWPAAPGTGTIDHLAFRSPDRAALDRLQTALAAAGHEVTPPKDRRYFTSLYVRAPGGTLLESATDTPGMTVDEPVETLGGRLFVPPADAARAKEIETMLPQIALPHEPRPARRDLPFVHRLYRPDDADGSALVLLHGTGGNEADLMPLARTVAPRATLLGLRGRSTEEGALRWFRRLSMARFDQADIRAEARAFAAFLPEALAAYDLDPAQTTLLGYSNGANFIAAAMQLHPGLTRRAVLLRAMQVLEEPPAADLTGAEVLMLTGDRDPYGQFAPALEKTLRAGHAKLEAHTIAGGHGLMTRDAEEISGWLARSER